MSKYFCNLENRNYVSKYMNSIENKDGLILENQEDILNETKNYFSKLYSFKEVESINLENLFSNSDTPKLSEEIKKSLDQKFTHTEMQESLKRMKNNKSPGNDGFTAEFYKKKIGSILVIF